jgi:hypothetical protein
MKNFHLLGGREMIVYFRKKNLNITVRIIFLKIISVTACDTAFWKKIRQQAMEAYYINSS